MKNILGIILGLVVSTNCYAWYGWYDEGHQNETFNPSSGVAGQKFFNQNGGSHPFATCAWGCPNAKPCCQHWTVHKVDQIKFEPYYDMTCDEWIWTTSPHYLSGGQKEECVKYEIVHKGGFYANQCVQWKYFDGSIRMIGKQNTTDYMRNNCNPRYKDVVTE